MIMHNYVVRNIIIAQPIRQNRNEKDESKLKWLSNNDNSPSMYVSMYGKGGQVGQKVMVPLQKLHD